LVWGLLSLPSSVLALHTAMWPRSAVQIPNSWGFAEFNDAPSASQLISQDMKGGGRDRYAGIHMKELRNSTSNRCPWKESNQAPFEYRSQSLPLETTCRLK
jgi:hypothetical protein